MKRITAILLLLSLLMTLTGTVFPAAADSYTLDDYLGTTPDAYTYENRSLGIRCVDTFFLETREAVLKYIGLAEDATVEEFLEVFKSGKTISLQSSYADNTNLAISMTYYSDGIPNNTATKVAEKFLRNTDQLKKPTVDILTFTIDGQEFPGFLGRWYVQSNGSGRYDKYLAGIYIPRGDVMVSIVIQTDDEDKITETLKKISFFVPEL